MATEPIDELLKPSEIYMLASRDEQVSESAKLLEFALREYSGDYASSLTQLYNSNRKVFEKELRDRVRPAFEVRNKLKNVAKYGQPDFEKMTLATDSFIAAATFLFQTYPKIYPEKFVDCNAASVQDSNFFEMGFEEPSGPTAFSDTREKKRERLTEPSELSDAFAEEHSGEEQLLDSASESGGFIPPTYSLPDPKTFFEPKLSLKQLEKMSHRLGRSLKAGVPIVRTWQIESENVSGKIRESFDAVRNDISSGERLSVAVAKHRCFPAVFCEMLQVGDETGRLDEVLLRLADHYRNLIQMRRTFWQGVTWPLLQLGVAVGVISLFFVALAILETVIANFKAPDIFFLGFEPIGNLVLFWFLLGVFGAGFFLLVKGIASGWFGDVPVRIALKIPLIGNTIKTMCLSRFAWSFGMAIDTGMDAGRAVRLGVRSTKLNYYTIHEDAIAADVGSGREFAVAIENTGAFPDDLLESVKVGELTGELTESLERLSDDYREQAELSLKKISQICGFAVSVFGFCVVGFLIFLMYANYIGMLNDAIDNPMGSLEEIRNGELPETTNLITAQRDKIVKDFVEKNQDFKNVELYSNTLTDAFSQGNPNDMLDALDPLLNAYGHEDEKSRFKRERAASIENSREGRIRGKKTSGN